MKILIIGGCGYIGSALYRHLEAAGHAVCAMDRLDRGNPGGVKNAKTDYRQIDPLDNIEAADVVIHLAGHSSVQACEADPWGAIDNNLTGFIPFLQKLSALEKPPLLLWASSGSVLSDVVSVYDTTKRTLEALVPRLYPRSIGLRFASVCGVSPNQRDDLILNAMVKSAVTKGYLTVANPFISKPILGLKDLCRNVEFQAIAPNIFSPTCDLSSFTVSPEQAAWAVKQVTGCEVRRAPASTPYEFRMEGPMWAQPTETLDSIISDLVAHYSAEKAEAA